MGYSRFLSATHGIELDLLQFVLVDDPIKISRLTLRNTPQRMRRLTATAYVEWVLGPARTVTAPMVVAERDPSGAILAHNPWNTSFGSYVALTAMPGQETHIAVSSSTVTAPWRG